MIALSHQNHFRWGYGEKFQPFKRFSEETWRVAYGSPSGPLGNFREECHRAARLLASTHPSPIWLCFSGGLDSEVMVRVFIECGIPFRAAFLRFSQGENDHEYEWTQRICRQLNVELKIFTLDLKQFFLSGAALDFADSAECSTPEMLATMWLSSQLEGSVVFGSGECFFVRENSDGFEPGLRMPYSPYCTWHLFEKESVGSWYKHFVRAGITGSPGFFQYTAEQIFSYCKIPIIENLLANRLYGKLSSTSSKLEAYRQFWPLEARPKYNGYENLRALVEDFELFLVNRYPRSRQIYYTPAHELYAATREANL